MNGLHTRAGVVAGLLAAMRKSRPTTNGLSLFGFALLGATPVFLPNPFLILVAQPRHFHCYFFPICFLQKYVAIGNTKRQILCMNAVLLCSVPKFPAK